MQPERKPLESIDLNADAETSAHTRLLPSISGPSGDHDIAADSRFSKLAFATLWFISLGNGLIYSFGILAPDLKTLGRLNQQEVNLIGGIAYTGGLLPQLPVSFLGTRFPRVVVLGSQLISTTGWGIAAILVWYSPTCVVGFAVCFAMVGFGGSSICATAVTNAKSDCSSRSSWVIPMFLVGFACSGVATAFAYAYGLPADFDLKNKIFFFFLGSAGFNALILILVSVWIFKRQDIPNPGNRANDVPVDNLANIQGDSLGDHPTTQPNSQSLPLCPQLKMLVGSGPVWAALLIMLSFFGASVNFYNNAGSIALSVDSSESEVTYIFITFSVAQLLGRLVITIGLGEKRPSWAYFFCLCLVGVLLTALSLLSLLANGPCMMYFTSAMNGACYGAVWSLLFIIPTHTLDAKSRVSVGLEYSVIYGALCVAVALGPLIFDLISGSLYDHHGDGSVDHKCNGSNCYSTYFIVSGGLVLAATVLAAYTAFWIKSRPDYDEIEETIDGNDADGGSEHFQNPQKSHHQRAASS